MYAQHGLNSKQKRIINAISKRLAQQQAAYLKTERECLTEFMQVVGYASPDDARQLVIERLQEDAAGGQTVFFNESDWPKALTRIALKQLQEWANMEVEAALEKLSV
jgi:hypothetical protein